MILQVNDINFENMSNDEAVRVLREVVQKPGPIKLVVAKCWDPNPKGYFTIPRTEPVRPIDPGAWVAHTAAIRGADVVDWLDTHVNGFSDRRDARKYASHMLKAGYIRHTVNKITFSEQCYYIFGDVLSTDMKMGNAHFYPARVES
ncbi:hypothetical protein LSTR_LSTR015039 [Laodelphax striatellus]|uniref:DEP domain-containing protein n=1 Tax=Laodelphax striatellus TaxID=195883 RepID=A0A482XSS5_LAOST|nr:hypothetical protein LSTR_LSTR015039 [Laodelphax striatellus]